MIKYIILLLFYLNLWSVDKAYIHKAIVTLQSGINMGNIEATYNLGLLYSQDILLDNSEVLPKDLKKAKYYLKQAYLAHHKTAMYNYVLILLEEKKYYESINLIDRALKHDVLEEKTQIVLTYLYSQIILNNFLDNEILVNKLKMYIEKVAYTNTAILDYIYANILILQKKESQAMVYITKACSNKKKNKRLINICKTYENNTNTSSTK